MNKFQVCFLAATVLFLNSCSQVTKVSETNGRALSAFDPAVNRDYTVEGDPYGHRSIEDIIVYAFSQTDCSTEDPQIYALKPDISIRSWLKWDKYGIKYSDYNSNYIRKCHENNILFIGGGTSTIIGKSEPINIKDFATRNAENQMITPPYYIERTPGLYRGSLANPQFRKYVVNFFCKQIDLGVDGISFDEVYGYYGRICVRMPWEEKLSHRRYLKYGPLDVYFDYNEGFDDYFIADFNRYLMNKYPDYKESDWISNFDMSPDNIIHKDILYRDLEKNFNYRKYLKSHHWESDPHNPNNPLNKEWGNPYNNRPEIHSNNFMEKYLKLYFKEMVISLREYARKKYNREILITANGIFPYTDFNSLGINGKDGDDSVSPESLEYVPVNKGHLDGSKSMKNVYLKLYKLSRDMSGDVPLALFIDFPTPAVTAYYQLSKSEKIYFWKLYGAEMYACGIFPAFFLKTTMPDDPSAAQSGVLNFFIEYSRFFKNHRDLYLSVQNTDKKANISIPYIEYNITYQPGRNRYFIHLINHNYYQKIMPKSNFYLSLNWEKVPSSVTIVSPDDVLEKPVFFKSEKGETEIQIEKLESYSVLIINLD